MDNSYHYRNNVIVTFNQKYEYGLYHESSYRIVSIQGCLLHDNETHEVLEKLQILFRKCKISIYDERNRIGFLRRFLIRRAVSLIRHEWFS